MTRKNQGKSEKDRKAEASIAEAERHSVPDSFVIERPVEVIGDREQALRWMDTAIRALGYATPISRLHDERGRAGVLRVLTQFEHGLL